MVERSDDFFTVERISKSFTLMETLEKEIDRVYKFANDTMNERTDMNRERSSLEKAAKIIHQIGEEFDERIYKFANDTMNERTDMNRERSSLEKAAKIIHQIGEEFDEKGIISVAESGNADALKALIVAISAHFSTLTAIVGNHDLQTY
uniref:PhoU domain-containing protein n=1 Tax=Ascaris lumbricoides TaxID=6252 RepID=A0A0M3IQR2_ASCLU